MTQVHHSYLQILTSLPSSKEITPNAVEMFCLQWVPKQPLLCSSALGPHVGSPAKGTGTLHKVKPAFCPGG